MGAKQHATSVVLAGLTAFAVIHFYPEAEPEPPRSAQATRTDEARPRSRRGPSLVDVQRARARAVADDRDDPPEAAPEPVEDPPRIEDRLSPEEADAAEAELHETLLADSREEPRDAEWAAPMEESLGDAIAFLQEDVGATLVDVECRSASCEATVEFESYGEARRQGPTLVASIVNRQCSKRMTLSGDPNEAPYATTLFFDCDVT